MSDIQYNLGSKIKEWRKSEGLSQKELAKKIGISRVTLGFYERDVNQIPFDVVVKIIKVLNIPTRGFFDAAIAFDSEIEKKQWLESGAQTPPTTSEAISADAKASIDGDIKKLNPLGVMEAAKRVHELTRIPEYVQQEMARMSKEIERIEASLQQFRLHLDRHSFFVDDGSTNNDESNKED